MSFAFAAKCITTRGRVSSMAIPNCAAICRICARSSAGTAARRAPDRPARCVCGSNGWMCSGAAFGVMFWPKPAFGFVPGAPPRPPPPNPREPAAAGRQHRRLIEVHRQIAWLVAVHNRALLVADPGAQNRAAHEKLRRLFDGHAGGEAVCRKDRRRGSFGNQRSAVLDERASSARPSMPIPPRMSSLEST